MTAPRYARAVSGAMTWTPWLGAIVRKGARKGRVVGDLSGGRVRVHWEDDVYSNERRNHLVMIGAAVVPPTLHPRVSWGAVTGFVLVGVLAALVLGAVVMIYFGPR